MKGLELSEKYYTEVGAPMIEDKFPTYKHRIAAGLVGDGSECFGFDDELSRDHDWGPSFCVWLDKQDFQAIGRSLQSEISRLPAEFDGFKARTESAWGGGRTGVFEIGQFYKRFIGFDHVPATLLEWRAILEGNLAVATNGKVFTDPLGEFTAFRNSLKEFYPEDIRLKKIASRCMTIAQAGQYNYMRCTKRGEHVAAQWTETKFISDTISMVFLLNRQYRPFFKWMHRAMKDLVILGEPIHQLLADMVTIHEDDICQTMCERKISLIEETCRLIVSELRRQGLSNSSSDFLLDHGPIVQSKIKDPQIRGMDVWAE